MKKILFYSLLLGITLLAGCRDENETVTKVVAGNSTLKVLIESDSRPRTAVGEDGRLTWVDNDRIGVYGTQTSNVPFAYNGLDEDSTAACFTGDLKPDEIPVRAYYPYQSGASIEGSRLTLELPSEMAYTENSNAPMIGVKQEDGSFLFRHLCGLMKVRVKGVPVGTSRFTITSVGENAPGIAGVATVADITTTDAVLALDDVAATQITVTLSSDEITDKTFYIPLPVGTYPQLSVSFENDDNVLFTKTVSDCEVKRGVMIEMPMAVATSELSVVKGYLETINEHISSMTEERTYDEFVTNLVDWIGEQPYIESVKKEENVILFTFTNGMESFIAFEIKEEYFGDDVASVQSRSVSYDEYKDFIENETMFQVADTNPNPENRIVPMKDENEGYKVLCYTPLAWKPISEKIGDGYNNGSYEHILFKKIVDESPIKLKYTLETNGTIETIKEQFPKNDVILITETHGYFIDNIYSTFAIPFDESLGQIPTGLEDDVYKWKRKGGTVFYMQGYKDHFTEECVKQNYILIPDSFVRRFIDNEQTLSVMCCKSHKIGEKSNARHWIGTLNSSLRSYNSLIIGDYYTALFNGLTYKEASDHCCPESQMLIAWGDFTTRTKFMTSDNSNNELSEERFFSIKTLPNSNALIDGKRARVGGNIYGWGNLKTDEIVCKVYHSTKRFSSPDEEHVVAEAVEGIKWGAGGIITDWLYSSDGKQAGVDKMITSEGEPGDTCFYCVGFEYKEKTYYGGVEYYILQEEITPGEIIDMGLPSGTKWRGWNIGANAPEDYGGLYGWGDPTGMHTVEITPTGYDGDLETWLNTHPAIDHYFDDDEAIACCNKYYGGHAPSDIAGNKQYDIAANLLGDKWRLPTRDEAEELRLYTVAIPLVYRGVEGVKLLSRNNFNSIFIPFAGWRFVGRIYGRGNYSQLWTSCRDMSSTVPIESSSYYIDKYGIYNQQSLTNMFRGLSVRPVWKE